MFAGYRQHLHGVNYWPAQACGCAGGLVPRSAPVYNVISDRSEAALIDLVYSQPTSLYVANVTGHFTPSNSERRTEASSADIDGRPSRFTLQTIWTAPTPDGGCSD